MSRQILPRHLRSQGVALAHDVLMVPVAWFLAFWFRYNLEVVPVSFYQDALQALLYILPVQLAAFLLFGLYRGIWRFASLPDIMRILKAVLVGTVVGVALLFVFTRAGGVPRSVPVIHAILLVMLLSGPRLIYRLLKDRHLDLAPGKRVLIVGSGKAGEMLARDILRNRRGDFRPVAFVDDKQRRQGREIHGLPVAGTSEDIPALCEELSIDIIMLAIPSASSSQMRRVVEFCESAGVPFRSVPQLNDLMSGNVQINHLRQVSIEDLLGRNPVSLDWQAIDATLAGKVILVTGAGGSIGSELCRQLAKLKPAKLVLLENSEFNLYSIEMELLNSYPELNLDCHLGDITDQVYVENLFDEYRPEVVFHAAAYKHVPMLENRIRQAVRNNVLGTRVVAEMANRYATGVFVLVSTDKAVNPANVMGASKRGAEIFCQNLNAHSDTRFITVRFGNVLGSAGSVIPLFRKQIEEGGPVTVTDPRMERYFMTIPEACQLIMQTVVMGDGGEIFVLDMGEPIKISYLAEQMIHLSGRTLGQDIQIEYIGLRPGEKLYEELFHEKEELAKTSHEKVLLAHHRQVDWEWLNGVMQQMTTATEALDSQQLRALLGLLVPEHENQSKPEASNKASA
ncbi:MAG: polysaccharide biosynthesis protein [Candidatus Thiodiazotropha weberae]|uniref:Multidrug MFS transporter n=1 Tax=Candidatus Thiodiazotropha endoloripes TaxID=1818881 RepID=A0A1E2UN52_9GAMM|nr:nucleoside-diphosphate sugar epimerase/dehydratase [Candidatus Thiodiazotropha endoloripes]MCG7899266.1 polysaccharide biosynthesis protein [Candidatus Thiodiazotropha weberae]MCG7902873.1 polysaccharide biosynthesis protein [Candidatus Thiodiazotropha weberae]ODB84430.1 multidrug MFS transporter [Candidatus Thiodiazotropha endoloripes]ODB91202.1 multidrug MFS transporter [Candidatus Thiodiazotropha endoloripes]ODB96119.1 multidrug MFS transporter [Candidatus Thiodiazotropha endoloripes]